MSNVHAIAPAYKNVKKHKEIMTLPIDIREKLEAWLVQDISPSKCAKRLQMGYNESEPIFTDVAYSTLLARIKRYYEDRILPNLMRTRAVGEADSTELVALGVEKPRIDAYRMQEDLLMVQQKRVLKALSQEDKLPTTMSTVRQEMALLDSMNRNLSYLQVELGMQARAPSSVSINTEEGGNTNVMITDTGKKISMDAILAAKELLKNASTDEEKLKEIVDGEVVGEE